MLLKNHLIEVFKKASLENNLLLKENIVVKWVHRFGFDSLNDLLIHSPLLMENQYEEENQEQNQEQISLIDEVDEEENQEQIKLKLSNTFENLEEKKCESNCQGTPISNGIFSKDHNPNNIKKLSDKQKLPLPNIKNLRKWINKDKKAS